MDFTKSIKIGHGIVDSLIKEYDYDDRDSMVKINVVIDNIESLHSINTNESEVDMVIDFLNEHSVRKNFIRYNYIRDFTMIPDTYIHAKISVDYLQSILSQFESELGINSLPF